MPFVLDASVTVRWRLADHTDVLASETLQLLQDDFAAVPAIWWYEVRNALIIQERHRNLDPTETAEFLDDVKTLPIRIDRDPDEAEVLTLARAHGLTVYDAAYLELAARLGHPLATLDQRLAAAARRASITLLAPEAP